MSKSKTNYTLKIMKILRLASQGSNFTGSYKKKSIFTQCIHYIHMECFLSPISSTPIVCILNLNTEGGTSHNKYCKWSSITTLFIPKLFTFLVLPFLFFLIVVVNFANIRFIFLGTFFSCLLPKADGSSFSSSLEKIWVVICWPGSTFPPPPSFLHVSLEHQFHNFPLGLSTPICWKKTHLYWRCHCNLAISLTLDFCPRAVSHLHESQTLN